MLVTKKGVSSPRKGGTSQTLCPKAAFQPHEKFLFLIKTRTTISADLLQYERSLEINGFEEERYSDHKRTGTFIARTQSNGNVYIAVTS